VARLRGFEPPTYGLEVRSSIQLSYRRFSFPKLLFALCALLCWSGRADLNGRPPAPKAGALTRLRYAPLLQNLITNCKAPNNLNWEHIPFSFERPVRPAHQLAGVTKVARYSSRRHPPAPKAGALTRLRYAPPLFRSGIDNIYCLIRQPPNLLLLRKMS
jgi:hypothetical protein